MKANYNKSEILKRAWSFYKAIDNELTFADCLRKSWHIAKNGNNTETFNEIYNKFNGIIYRHILNKIHKYEIAEELTTEVFLRLDKHLKNYDVYRAKISTWLFTIANNIVIDYYRANHSNMFVSVDNFVDEEGREFFQIAAPSSYEIEETMQTNENGKRIALALENLKPMQKRIAELFFLDDRQYNEIAEILSIPIGTVKGNINRIREKLQAELKELHTSRMRKPITTE